MEYVIDENGKVKIPMQFITKKEFSISIIDHAIKNTLVEDSWHELLIKSKKIIEDNGK
ncbi:MAG: hypothetical protein ABFS35_08745 [Bacteroidota bacterium]